MRYTFSCPMDDAILFADFDLRSDRVLHEKVDIVNYTPAEISPYPYVPTYFQQYNQQIKPLKAFLREHFSGLRPRTYLLALHDDATELEATDLSELLIKCGAKDTITEYRSFLLSSEPEYLAVTGSKRAVTVTHIIAEKDDTERIFIPVNEANSSTVHEAIHELDSKKELPVFSFDLPETLPQIGEAVTPQELVLQFIKII